MTAVLKTLLSKTVTRSLSCNVRSMPSMNTNRPRARYAGVTQVDRDPTHHTTALYARESHDGDGDASEVSNQIDDGMQKLKREGVPRVIVYPDNHVSATKKRKVKLPDGWIAYRVVRPEWDRMIADARNGLISSIMVASIDRLLREPRELEDLIEMVEHFGVWVRSLYGAEIDLSTDSGIMNARLQVVVANNEARNISRRATVAKRRAALTGRPNAGSRPYGWNADKKTLHPVESPILRQAVDDVIDRHLKVSTIVTRWQRAGILSASGKMWRAPVLTNCLLSPRICGLASRHGEILRDDDGNEVAGLWTPLISRDRWEELVTALGNPKPRNIEKYHAPRSNKYLLTHVMRCGVCMERLVAGKRRSKVTGEPECYYSCRAKILGGCGGPAVKGPILDAYITELVLSEHERASKYQKAEIAPWDGQADLDEIRAEQKTLLNAMRNKEVSAAMVLPFLKELDARKAALENGRRAHRQMIEQHDARVTDLRTRWADPEFSMEERQAAVSQSIDSIILHPVPKGVRRGRFDPARLNVVWRSE